MPDIPLLWASGARKEAMELLRKMWIQADQQMREAISSAICAGPPAALLKGIEDTERERSRDRRIFDRLVVLQRLGEPPLTPTLEAEAARLHEAYPNWRALEGEQAHFGTWIETRYGPETRYTAHDLKVLSDEGLIETLNNETEMREGLLEGWRQLSNAEPARTITVLEKLSRQQEPAPVDVWQYSLWGVRDGTKQPEVRDRLVAVLQTLPASLFDQPTISDAIADVLQAAAASPPSPTHDEHFWRLFDRTLSAVELDPSNSDQPDGKDWVTLAINRSMGSLATAFFTLLFARELKVGAGIPTDLEPRLDALLAPKQPVHRPARVVAASRLSYLHAVDPEWARAHLIPSFDWEDEVEALAAWQGYAWQPRLDKKLWLAIKPHFLPVFTTERFDQLDHMGRTISQMLMLVGIEFGLDELPRDAVRQAIRAMPDPMRSEAVAWVASYLEQREQGGSENDDQREATQSVDVDDLWSKRVWPWIERVWPPDPALRSHSISEQFALVAIATEARFPEAVAALRPYMMPADAYYVIAQLETSTHPDDHPQATLDLIDAIVDPNEPRYGEHSLRSILNRALTANPEISDSVVFRTWNDRLRVHNL